MSQRSESGQVIVEQALIMPMMVFLILGIVQLTMLQHARIITDYAAFNAARAGAVYDGNITEMERAAYISVIPTMGRSDDFSHWGTLALKATLEQGVGDLLKNLKLPGLKDAQIVSVEILSPKPSVFGKHFAHHLDNKQIDFDDIRKDAAAANLLSIHVRYMYRMRIPFANWMIQTMWFAGRMPIMLKAMHGVNFVNPNNALGESNNIALAAAASNFKEMALVVAARQAHLYYFPINTYYTMRMQSNLYKSNVK